MKTFRDIAMKVGFGLVMVGLFLLAGMADAHAQPTITAKLKAVPDSYSGKCPATIKFEGMISVKNLTRPPLRLQYKFIRSDGAHAPVNTLLFEGDGAKPVHTTWTLGGPELPAFSGWEAIKVVYPQDVESNHADFKIKCAEAKPEITGYRENCGNKGANVTILGRHFGTQTGKGVALGGHGIHVDLPVVSWSDTVIVAKIRDTPQIQMGQWYYIGVEKADHSEWLSNISKNITICKEKPRGNMPHQPSEPQPK